MHMKRICLLLAAIVGSACDRTVPSETTTTACNADQSGGTASITEDLLKQIERSREKVSAVE